MGRQEKSAVHFIVNCTFLIFVGKLQNCKSKQYELQK